MKTPVVLLLVVVAAAGGFFAGSTTKSDDRGGRSETSSTRDPEYRRTVVDNLTDEEAEKVVRTRYDGFDRWRADSLAAKQAQPDAADEAEAEVPDEELLRGFKDAMKGQLPQWKSMMSVTAKRAGSAIAGKLDLDEQTTKVVSEAFDKEGERSAEIAMALMMGDFEGDEDDALAAMAWWMGTAGTMSDELALELSGTLNDEQIGAVREEMRIRNQSEMKMQAEMQIRMMTIPDLSDAQTTELTDMFSDGGMMKEQGRVWTEIMKNPRALVNAKSDGDWEQLVAPSMEVNRRRMRAILDDTQYKAYEAYEKRNIKQARMWVEPYLPKAK
jgi:hypothetical protein